MSVKRSDAICPVWANDAAHGRWYQTESNVRMPTSYACRVGPVHSADHRRGDRDRDPRRGEAASHAVGVGSLAGCPA